MQMNSVVFTPWQTIIMILAVAAGTAITRFLPFLIFPENRKVPSVVLYLGKVLPPAMIGLLVVYCLKNVNFFVASYGITEIISILLIVILHNWKRNVLLSIGGGTVAYMLLLRLI